MCNVEKVTLYCPPPDNEPDKTLDIKLNDRTTISFPVVVQNPV